MPQARDVELNEPAVAARRIDSLRQHLINASNELYLFELQSQHLGRVVPDSVKRAHASVRAELKRMDAE